MSQALERVGEADSFQRDAKPAYASSHGAAGSVSQSDNPIALFQTWFREAVDSGMKEPSAVTVATVDADGSPDARMMLIKGVDEGGFVFYTNMGSAKARALMHDPRVALCFYWLEIGKQVRVRGKANIVTDEEADAYFATRPRLSQISAWASKTIATYARLF
jgi:pyridoxamine 5'-phosphate oxidase